jgi:hypothetical protein
LDRKEDHVTIALLTRGYVYPRVVTIFGDGPAVIDQADLAPEIDRASTGEPDLVPGVTGSEELVPSLSGATEDQVTSPGSPTGTADELVPIITDAKEED